MADIFGNTSASMGCYSVYNLDGGPGRGAQLVVASQLAPGSSGVLAVTSYSVSESEVVSFAKTFGGAVYTYAFGHNPVSSVARVTAVGFMIDDVAEHIHDFYKSNRVGNPGSGLATLTFGRYGGSISGYIIGLSGSTMQTAAQLQKYDIAIALPEAQ